MAAPAFPSCGWAGSLSLSVSCYSPSRPRPLPPVRLLCVCPVSSSPSPGRGLCILHCFPPPHPRPIEGGVLEATPLSSCASGSPPVLRNSPRAPFCFFRRQALPFPLSLAAFSRRAAQLSRLECTAQGLCVFSWSCAAFTSPVLVTPDRPQKKPHILGQSSRSPLLPRAQETTNPPSVCGWACPVRFLGLELRLLRLIRQPLSRRLSVPVPAHSHPLILHRRGGCSAVWLLCAVLR